MKWLYRFSPLKLLAVCLLGVGIFLCLNSGPHGFGIIGALLSGAVATGVWWLDRGIQQTHRANPRLFWALQFGLCGAIVCLLAGTTRK